MRVAAAALWAMLSGCGGDSTPPAPGPSDVSLADGSDLAMQDSELEPGDAVVAEEVASPDDGDAGAGPREPQILPLSAIPCEHPAGWPHSLESAERPFVVHFQWAQDAPVAAEMRGHLNDAWAAHVDVLGFRPPVPDTGECGPDGRFDVFLWAGQEAAWVDVLGGYPETTHHDQLAYMVVDPWGPYGGELLRATVFHELSHAFQAADDWFESGAVYEMSATYVEGLLVPESDDWEFVLEDFQAHPDWSLLRNDDYETWYMYGAALLLHFLHETWFEDQPSFVGDWWFGMRGSATWADSLEAVLQPKGVTLGDAVAAFAAWRWTASPPPVTTTADVDPDPMLLGSAYVPVPDGAQVTVIAPEDPDVIWALQKVEGAVVLTALPAGPFDPESTYDKRYEVALSVE